MTESNEPTQSSDEQQPNLRKKWAPPKRKRGAQTKFHLMSSNDTTFCGKHIHPDMDKVLDFDDWCPLDHPKDVCPRCLEWWNSLRPGQYGKKKALAKS